MIRSELVELLAQDNPDLSPKEVERIVASFFDAISQQLSDGGRIELRGFGAFSVRHRPSRTGRNPRTSANVSINQKYLPFFKTGKEMRERLNKA